jgi:hypothetical protein
LGCFGPNQQESTANYGFTIFTPGPTTRVIYVSWSGGNDSNDGLTPATAVKTPLRAYRISQNGDSDSVLHRGDDWILYKRGDTWTGGEGQGYLFTSNKASGISATDKYLFSSYGASVERPRFLDTSFGNYDFDNLTIAGLRYDRTNEISVAYGYGAGIDGGGDNVLLEDNYFGNWAICFHWESGANVTFRRNICVDSYATNTHAQGFLGSGDGVLFEENFFDHDGWREGLAGAQATLFNHNFYIYQTAKNVTMRGNISSRAAATGAQVRTNGLVENNLWIDNPIHGFSGCMDYPHDTVRTTNNVFIGGAKIDTYPRGNGWSMLSCQYAGHAEELDHNIFTQKTCEPGDMTAIFTSGVPANLGVTVNIHDNITYHWCGGAFQFTDVKAAGNTINVTNNITESDDSTQVLTSSYGMSGYNFSGNRWFTKLNLGDAGWFVDNDQVAVSRLSANQWGVAYGETNAVFNKTNFVDPTRTAATYMGTLGQPATNDALYAAQRQQSRGHFDPRLTAPVINDYIRAGFALSGTQPGTMAQNTVFTITTSQGAGGSISPSGAVSVGLSAAQTFAITPNSGYQISSVTVDGVNQGTSGTYTFSNVNANHTIRAAFVPTGGAVAGGSLLASYTFEGGVTDASGNGYDLTNHNGTFATGHNGQALSLAGGAHADFNQPIVSGYPFSLSLWFKANTVGGNLVTMSSNSVFDYFDLSFYDGVTVHNVSRNVTTGEYRDQNYLDMVSANTWHHIVAVFDQASQTYYLDGGPAQTKTGNVTFPQMNSFTLGALPIAGYYNYDGLIDDVKIYSKALSAAEVQTLYSGGTVSSLTQPSSFFGSILDLFSGIFRR